MQYFSILFQKILSHTITIFATSFLSFLENIGTYTSRREVWLEPLSLFAAPSKVDWKILQPWLKILQPSKIDWKDCNPLELIENIAALSKIDWKYCSPLKLIEKYRKCFPNKSRLPQLSVKSCCFVNYWLNF